MLARFHRECGTVSELEHPNTIQFFDFGQTPDGQLYIAMEFVQGQSLSDALKPGPMRARSRAAHPGAGVRLARRGSRPRYRPPRSQARQRHPDHPRRAGRLRQGPRLRHRQAQRGQRSGAGAKAHAAGDGARNPAVHEPRAVHRQRARPSQRHLLARRDGLRDARRDASPSKPIPRGSGPRST